MITFTISLKVLYRPTLCSVAVSKNLAAGADLGGGGGGGGPEGAAAPPFSSSEIYFLSKYTIIL